MLNQLNKLALSISRKILSRIEITLLSLLILFSSFIYSFINWQKHIHFQTFAWDTSVFDQQVYLFSISKPPYSSLMKMHGLADHFHPLVLIIGGFLYRIWADPRMLFILQSVIVSLSAIPLYFLAKHIISRLKIPPIGAISISLSLVVMYLFSVAFQAMVLDEFHDDVLVTLPILWMIYFIVRKKFNLYWIAYLFVLLTKEEYGLLGVPIGLYIFLTQKRLKHAFFTALVGIATFYILVFHIMPTLAGSSEYDHFRTENKPQYLIQKFINNPQFLITNFIDHPKKQETIITSLVSYGLLPLFSPPNLILPISSLAIRFYDETTIRRYEFNNHYASPFIPFVAVSTIFGLYTLTSYLNKARRINAKKLWLPTTLFIISVVASQNLLFHGPINSLFKKSFYETQPWEYDARELIKQIPPKVPISTQNSLLPHLSHREDFYLLPEVKDVEYIAVDLHDGPNKFAALSAKKTRELIENLIENKHYKITWQKNESFLLQRL